MTNKKEHGEVEAEPKVKVVIAYDDDLKNVGNTVELPASVAARKIDNGWARLADDKRTDKTDDATVLKPSMTVERPKGE